MSSECNYNYQVVTGRVKLNNIMYRWSRPPAFRYHSWVRLTKSWQKTDNIHNWLRLSESWQKWGDPGMVSSISQANSNYYLFGNHIFIFCILPLFIQSGLSQLIVYVHVLPAYYARPGGTSALISVCIRGQWFILLSGIMFLIVCVCHFYSNDIYLLMVHLHWRNRHYYFDE